MFVILGLAFGFLAAAAPLFAGVAGYTFATKYISKGASILIGAFVMVLSLCAVGVFLDNPAQDFPTPSHFTR